MKKLVTVFKPLLGKMFPGILWKQRRDDHHAGFPKNRRKLQKMQRQRAKGRYPRISAADKARARGIWEQQTRGKAIVLIGPPRCGKGLCFNNECSVTLKCQETERKNGRPFKSA